MKQCKRCLIKKDLDSFYRHKRMKDGHLNFCKDCKKTESINHRNKNIEYYRAYDRDRGNRQNLTYLKDYRANNPDKYRAHNAVNNAVRDGRLKKVNCQKCGASKNIHGHHHDYKKPLDVVWLCAACHQSEHEK